MNEKIFLAALHSLWFTHKKLFEIFEYNQNYKELFQKLDKKILEKYKFQEKQIESILNKKQKLDLFKLEKKLNQRSVKIITIFDEKYPIELKKIANTPFLFYLRWNLDNSKYFSIVWARKITSYWLKVIEKIIPDLIKQFIIVSGWAFGCDSEAHKQSLKAWWKTIAVLWTGIDIDYPVQNEIMYNDIVKTNWAIISIFPIWTPGSSFSFPIRNEIVAWLSVWTLVVEAEEKSGSLITAKLALDLWKDLFAIPWDIFSSRSDWTNKLISSWEAKLVKSSNDILEEYWLKKQNITKKSIVFNDEIEEKIYNIIQTNSLTVDELTKKLNLELQILNLKLSMMELSWNIQKTWWWKYITI